MSSSQGQLTHITAMEPEELNVTTAEVEWLEHQQIFELMDSLLSFEACLYHQILPLRLAQNDLLIAMVYPQDTEALDYINRILSYVKYGIAIKAIAVDDHHTILSAYLNYKNTLHPNAQKQHQPKVELIDQSLNADSENNPPSKTIAQHPELPQSQVDNDLETTSIITPLKNQPETTPDKTPHPDDLTTLMPKSPDTLSPNEVLAQLPPRILLQELLRRVVAGGIGRLYLERQPYQGRILWSDNGILQSVIDNLPLSVLQGVINELKQFAGLPISISTEAKQVEKEYFYDNNRLLLRLRVMPGMYGEEATLQVLRGAALKFYQQKQLGNVNREALNIAQQLNSKLHEMQQRLILNPNLQPEQLDALIALNTLVENLDHQIKAMRERVQISKTIK